MDASHEGLGISGRSSQVGAELRVRPVSAVPRDRGIRGDSRLPLRENHDPGLLRERRAQPALHLVGQTSSLSHQICWTKEEYRHRSGTALRVSRVGIPSRSRTPTWAGTAAVNTVSYSTPHPWARALRCLTLRQWYGTAKMGGRVSSTFMDMVPICSPMSDMRKLPGDRLMK